MPNQKEKVKSNGASPLPGGGAVPTMSSGMVTIPSFSSGSMVGMGANAANQINLLNAINTGSNNMPGLYAAMQASPGNSTGQVRNTNSNGAMDSTLAAMLSSGIFPSTQQQQSLMNLNPLVMAALVQQLQNNTSLAQPPSFLAGSNYNPIMFSNQGDATNNNNNSNNTASNTNGTALAAAQAFASLLQAQGQLQPLPPFLKQQQKPQSSSTAIPKVSSHSSDSLDGKKRKVSSTTSKTTSTTTATASVPDTDVSELTSISESQDALSFSERKRKTTPKKKLPKKVDGAFGLPSTMNRPPQQHQRHPSPAVQYNPLTVPPIFPSISNQSISPLVMAQMQKQSLPELEHHVNLLRELNHPIPHQVWQLLLEQRAIEEKKMAKRLINRKSASTSRARKKKLVEEMAQNNARLRRQAIILSLLPDLVMAITTDGEITFCSGQVERVLRHNIGDMIGMNISKLITPASQDALAKLIDTLLATDKVAREDGNNESGRSSNSGNTSGAPMVSEQSDQGFPLSVVKVNSFKDSSDSSGNEKAAASIVAPSPSLQSKDDADTSDPSNLSTANEALGRNVRSHNELLKQKKSAKKKADSHKDDVTGDTVTANNAGARLSSLLQPHESEVKKVASVENLEDMTSSSSDSLLGGVEDKRHKKRKAPENASDDSGYREDSGSSTSETSNSGRRRTLVPTCNICLIRDDLTTIWCEVTSSVRTRHIDEDSIHETQTTTSQDDKRSKTESANTSDDHKTKSSPNQVKELLLCLRPLRDGTEKVSEEFRVLPKKSVVAPTQNNAQTSDSGTKNSVTGSGSAEEAVSSCSKSTSSVHKGHSDSTRPMKKRRPTLSYLDPSEEDTKTAVDSLVRLSNCKS